MIRLDAAAINDSSQETVMTSSTRARTATAEILPAMERPTPSGANSPGFGSDVVADTLRALDIPYIALNPGASYRGLHDSLVNYLGNERPQMLLCLHEESAVAIAHGYAKVAGKAMAVAVHSNVGLFHATPTGNFVITLSSVDLGQGLRTVMTQIAAETLGVPAETVVVDTADTDTGPHCMGTFASRATHRVGNAIMRAAEEARAVLLEVAAEELEAAPEDLEPDGAGNIVVKGAPGRSIGLTDLALAAHFKHGRTISGRGIYMKPKSEVDPETGRMDPDSTEAHACTVADVEVDTETGEVTVLAIRSAYEVGRQVNPALVQGQIVGGAWMGMSHALYETTAPYYPAIDHAPSDFNHYVMPGISELPDIESRVLEIPSSNGPYGVKGVGEMTANSPIPAIINAIHDAVGVWVTELPATPERVLRALEEKENAADA
jgi:CO/xanthine dehydrogenase Mo-binding subunit